MNYIGKVTDEYGVDHLVVNYEVHEGDFMITAILIDGRPVDQALWAEVEPHAENVAWQDYLDVYASRQEDMMVTAWERKMEADYD